MARPISKVAPGWWDYTTLDPHLLADAAQAHTERPACSCRATASKSRSTTRSKNSIVPKRWNTSASWQQATADNPVGICGPIGPTEQLPLVARIVNALGLEAAPCPLLGHGRVDRKRPAGVDGSSALVRQGRHGALLQSHPAGAAHAGREHSLPARSGSILQELRRRALPGHAGRARRGEALGVQRPAQARRPVASTSRRRRPCIASSNRGSPTCTR